MRLLIGTEAFSGDAHAFLVWTYKNSKLPVELRLDAAKAAIGYERPRLQTQTVVNEITTIDPALLSDDELERVIALIERRIEEDRAAEQIAQLVFPSAPREE
jgi:hypothetical protein